jgi:alginate O-acetyltransferase complex protein AlgI
VLFNTLQFLLFAIVVITTYYVLPRQWMRLVLLLVSSAYFYMVAAPVYIIILALVIAIDYVCGLVIQNSSARISKLFLLISICSNIGILIFFKYALFFTEGFFDIFHNVGVQAAAPNFLLNIALPIGLSFHTFQSLSYVIDVHKKKLPAEKNILVFANYVMFFPQLVAGPIERAKNILPQFKTKQKLHAENVKQGLLQVAYGLILKVALADRLGIAVQAVWQQHEGLHWTMLVYGVVCFAVQIYCDFHGYTTIAKGLARMMGIQFSSNFNRPYLSINIQEFWQRWHISLSSWFRDYVYTPIGI